MGTQEVSRSIGMVEEAARETGGAAEQISTSSSELSQQADILKREVSRFLDQVRTDRKNLQLVAWDASLEVGSPEIDRHHKEMIDQLNHFFASMMYGDGAAGAVDAIAMLVGSMREHFADEEEQMTRMGYPGAADHIRDHADFTKRFDRLRADVDAGKPDAANALFEHLADWTKSHILAYDKKVAEYASIAEGRLTRRPEEIAGEQIGEEAGNSAAGGFGGGQRGGDDLTVAAQIAVPVNYSSNNLDFFITHGLGVVELGMKEPDHFRLIGGQHISLRRLVSCGLLK